jgi:hypothetical protein
MAFFSIMTNIITASKNLPCPHCGKTDWCYFLENLSVCQRDQPPSHGWKTTKKHDRDGKPYYAPIDPSSANGDGKPAIIKTTTYPYYSRTGAELVRVIRQDLNNGSKKILQQASTGNGWVYSTKHLDRASIPIYRYKEIREAVRLGQLIFFVEGEGVADCLVALGLQATTNLRGSGGLAPSDLEDLKGAALVICPDRDKPGMRHSLMLFGFMPSLIPRCGKVFTIPVGLMLKTGLKIIS